MANEKDAQKRITLAEGFLQKYSNSDFKANAYVAIMQTYQQLNNSDKAMEAAKKAVEIDPNNLQALSYLSFAFPFVFKPGEADEATKLSRADSDARHGLEALQKFQKPQNVTDEQFNQYVKAQRSIFNGAIGFAALQRKDYAAAVTSFKAATEDNASDYYSFYRAGLAYLFSTPRDYDNSIWNMARAVSLAKAAKDQNGEAFEKYLKRTYVDYHGNDQGLADILTQAAASPTPPAGFKVAAMEMPKATGNANTDAFNSMTFALKLGGEKAEKQWGLLKGQPIELGGSIDSIEKGTDPGTYLARIAVLDQSRQAGGYDIEVKDGTQPNVKNLQKGDLVRFRGTADTYTAAPLVLTLVGEITTDLPDKPPAKAKPKPTRKAAPVRRRTAAAAKKSQC
jgi:tetratricopeptide (TPR) repeat protein